MNDELNEFAETEVELLDIPIPDGYVLVREKELVRLERLASQRNLSQIGITRVSKDTPKKKRKTQQKSRKINRRK